MLRHTREGGYFPGASHGVRRIGSVARDLHQGNDVAIKSGRTLLVDDAHESLVRGDEWATLSHCEGEIETIICRVIHVDGETRRVLQEGMRGQKFDIRRP